MLRKIILAASALAFATAAHAGTETGPYVGVAVTVDAPNADVQGLDSIGSTGVGGSAYAGYNVALGNGFFVAPEANIDLNTAEARLTSGTDSFRLKSRWGWGVGARAGYDISDSTAAYVRAGYARNQIKTIENDVSDKSWGEGIRVGGGLETQVAPHAKLRAEYNYYNYERGLSSTQGLLGISYAF
ncbi:outer membrane protein [Sphingomonas cavernae]|uniref:Porin family protein n=1 Tax=Sphingomonas cavernae TaxID=2320861 RepID=A0A418WQK3_9SPHN|nr:porin family protein [Sphingomonas cavernae]RJF93532.1 porin family protein [Sphingomonas cavernae]